MYSKKANSLLVFYYHLKGKAAEMSFPLTMILSIFQNSFFSSENFAKDRKNLFKCAMWGEVLLPVLKMCKHAPLCLQWIFIMLQTCFVAWTPMLKGYSRVTWHCGMTPIIFLDMISVRTQKSVSSLLWDYTAVTGISTQETLPGLGLKAVSHGARAVGSVGLSLVPSSVIDNTSWSTEEFNWGLLQ